MAGKHLLNQCQNFLVKIYLQTNFYFGKSMKIFVDENIPLGQEAFQDLGEVVRFAGRSLTNADLKTADALIIRSITKVNAALLKGTPVRFVATATIGTDHVDQTYLKANQIGFASAPGCNANSVGEYISSALTSLEIDKGLKLQGKILGIIGYGHVGKNLASKAKSLGLQIRKCDPPLRDLAQSRGLDTDAFFDLSHLLAECDILSLHVPLVKDGPNPTLGLVNAVFFAKLGKPVVLLNSCRGEVIDEPDLQRALDSGHIQHLVLDVFAHEPQINQSLAARADIITPHIAGYSLQGKLNGTLQVSQALRQFFSIDSLWSPTYSGPENPDIIYPSGVDRPELSDEAFRQMCIAQAYPIMKDDQLLRSSFFSPNPSQTFDRLRRDYSIRHEFSGFTVRGVPKEKRELRSQLFGLGFSVE
jgi:erythronate-4-phosphate dehydrogenase